MKQPGYGMQHRQIDDDLKTMGSHSGQLGGSTGFVVGQVVDVKALQANTPYRLVPDPRAGDGANYQDQAKSATTDYLGLGNQFGSSEPLWSNPSVGSEAAKQQTTMDDHRRTSSQSSVGGVEQKRSSSPTNRPYRAEAEKERAWLGMRNSGSGRSSPTGHGYGSISQQQQPSHDGNDAVGSRHSSSDLDRKHILKAGACPSVASAL